MRFESSIGLLKLLVSDISTSIKRASVSNFATERLSDGGLYQIKIRKKCRSRKMVRALKIALKKDIYASQMEWNDCLSLVIRLYHRRPNTYVHSPIEIEFEVEHWFATEPT